MEVRRYWLLLRKWYWLLIIGAVVGGAAAYIYSIIQPTIYQSRTRVMVNRVADPTQAEYIRNLGDRILAETYKDLFTVEEVMGELSDRLGYKVNLGQINVQYIQDTNLLDISVSDGDPQRTADIANTLVDVFAGYSETIQTSRFTSSEQTLEAQIIQVEEQINKLQEEISQTTEFDEELAAEQNQVQLEELKTQLDLTESEIIKVEGALEAFFPEPLPTSTPETNFSSTATPFSTPTLAPAALVEYKETQNKLDELQKLRDLYINAYTNLLVMGESSNPTNNANRQIRQNQLETTLSLYQQIYTSLLNNYEQVRLSRLRDIPNIIQVHPAIVPSKPIQPQPLRNAILGSVIGIALTGAFALLLEYLDDSLKTPEDIQYYLQLPVLGMIGEMKGSKEQDLDKDVVGVYTADHPLSVISEGFRNLRTNIELVSHDEPLKSLLITSSNPTEGKSTIALNLAVVMAQGGNRTYLLDSDLRRPSIHNHLHLDNRKGLSNLFGYKTQADDVILTWGDPAIGVITSGPLPPNPNELLNSKRMDSILNTLNEQSDIVIIDTSPSIVSDPIVLSTKVDGVLIVVEPGKTKIGSAQVLIEQLERAHTNILGVVLNRISRRSSYYYSQYQYYSKEDYNAQGYGHFQDG